MAECASNDQTTACADNQCEKIGTVEICKQCRNQGSVPIDGVCKVKGDAPNCKKVDGGELEANAQACGKCTGAYFLYKGGCYQLGGTVGFLICNDSAAGDVEGVCSKCNTTGGFFRNPEAAANTDSCISCGDATGVKIPDGSGTGNTYKGVDKCIICQPPQAATPNSGQQKAATCTTCLDGYYGEDCSQQCDGTCKTCVGTESTKCTSCKADKPYLKKTQPTSQVGECVAADTCAQGNTHYADANTDPKTCKACAEGTFEGCETCEKSTEGAVACKTCGSQKKIRPDKKGCIDTCPPDVSTEKSGVCECVTGYAPSADGSSCASASANRSGLSTGAIAGISVAVIVVVGGLVGFLCWWFVCRGKA